MPPSLDSDGAPAEAGGNEIRGRRPTVLVFVGWSEAQASGALRSVIGMVDALSQDFDFKIIAGHHGASDRIVEGEWETFGSAKRYVVNFKFLSIFNIAKLINDTRHDIVMLSGFFDREFTLRVLIARKCCVVPKKPTILSPLGEFDPGAIMLKARRKRAYLRLCVNMGLLSDIWIHVSDKKELEDAERWLPDARGYFVANDIAQLRTPKNIPANFEKPIRLIFISRISRKKNLHAAIAALSSVKAEIHFDIFGPIEDIEYWSECTSAIAASPPHVTIEYHGIIDNSQIESAYATADIFFMPTLGENFGHAILESLSCGVPVLISDRTPWRDLTKRHAGWDLPLADIGAFSAKIDEFSAMTQEERARLSLGARATAERFVSESCARGDTAKMLQEVLRIG